MSHTDQKIIQQTRKWLTSVVIDLNFCPFANRELEKGSIYYAVVRENDMESCLESLIFECQRLDQTQDIATSLLIYPDQWQHFDDFLNFLAIAESLLEQQGYQGVYQFASFHPHYQFSETPEHDPANYTNRSPYPMLHLLREDRMAAALLKYPNPEQIPEHNIQRARVLGEEKLKILLAACKH